MVPARIFIAPDPNGKPTPLVFMERAGDFDFTGIRVVSDVSEADFVVAPRPIRVLAENNNREYVERIKAIAQTHRKQAVIFLSGDLAHREHIDNAIVFKHSLFRNGKRQNEITSVPFVDDPYESKEFVPRGKGRRPIVAFCGYAELRSSFDWIKYHVRNVACDAVAALTHASHWRAHKRGIYFRKKSMDILSRDPRIETHFIVRDVFFGSIHDENNAVYRQEYLDNMRTADFALAPRGDGNHSRRFFRALSLGVVPVLIDTDMVLPLENVIDYSKFILRVPHTEMHTLPDRIINLWNSLSDEEFQNMQRKAREAYVTCLNQSAFYNTVFPLLKSKELGAL